MNHSQASRGRLVAVGIAAAAMTVMLWPHLGYVPLWDGDVYAACVMDAAFGGISVESLRCAGHPSQGWAAVLALPQLFSPGNIVLLHATNLVLGIVAVAAFRVVLDRVFPDKALARELDLVAIASAVHPVLLSTLLQPNIDFGVYVFFFVALAGLLTPGRTGTAVAIAGGTLAVFSKETGVVAYGFAVLAVLGIEVARAGIPFRSQLGAVARRAAVLALPIVFFGAHVAWWNTTQTDAAIWKHGWQQSPAEGFKFFDLSEPVFVSYAAGLGVLGFMWVAWLPVAWDGLAGLARMARRSATRVVAGADPRTLVAITVMTVGLTYVLTSFRTWSNLRYFALLYPLFLLLMYASLHRLGARTRLRHAVLGVVIGLFVLASYRSVDPLSRVVYGTFDAGARTMYRMASITGEFDGPGRDQLVYNLEFAGYHHVQDALYARMRPTAATVIAAPRPVRWNIWSPLQAATFRRTMRRDSVVTPVYGDEVDVATRRPADAWFLEFSNRSYADKTLEMLLSRYRVTDSIVVVSHGQRLVARHLVRQEAVVLP